MKLTVTGATGFVGTEVIRQSLANPAITSLVALARRSVAPADYASDGADASKFSSVVLEDWENEYPENVKQALAGADACIWALATTPTQSMTMEFSEVTKICHDYTVKGLDSMAKVGANPFRFVYVSGLITERDPNKAALMPGGYLHMRGAVESAVIEYSAQHTPDMQVMVAKPGIIDGPSTKPGMMHDVLRGIYGYVPSIHISEIAAAMIGECINGISKDTLDNSDLQKAGKTLLKEDDYLQAS